ncbi:fimbrial protein [Bacteroides sp. BFG-606]|uniref:fimbrial protein n=1 Tax=Bacteroides sp. BFG-606 TaxID=2972763 RepID=UPI00216652D8|nr:fimbrial protein [Bacteroides sp. BFG-606]MCS2333707.1 fimbrial protein [Bacteroides sp. BFG-606]
MKVKSLFLSMCAIAALASCSQSDDVAPTGGDAPEAKVILKLEGDGVNATRAADTEEAATEPGAAIKNVTVFFFNPTGFIVGKPQFKAVSDPSQKITISTTTDAADVVVIANLGDKTQDGTFDGIASLSQLQKLDFSSIATDGAGKVTVNQSKDNLYSSGMGEITFNDNEGTASVQLHFVAARIKTVKIAWTADQNYAATEAELTAEKTKWFTIKKVYMMTAQTNSPLIPATTGTWKGFVPQNYAFAGGVAWGAAPWTWADNNIGEPKQTDDYLALAADLVESTSNTNQIDNALASKSWYLFENSSASSHPTGLVIEVLWRSKEQSEKPEDLLTKYFTMYFGESGTSGAAQPLLEAGKTYAMTLSLKGSFKPGGNAGGGGDDPTKPSVDASVEVTVNAAKWTTAEITKDFQ